MLRNSDIALLARLNRGPLELGDIPIASLNKLTALGLARKVLGSCNITSAGQLSFRRHSFTNASRQRFAHVTPRHPVFLHEARLRTPISRARLAEFLTLRRAFDARVSRAARLAKWLARLASETAGQFRPRHVLPAELDGGARSKLKHEPHKGSS